MDARTCGSLFRLGPGRARKEVRRQGDGVEPELPELRRKTILLKLEQALDRPAYNYILHTSPFDTQALPHYHWHIEVIPRLTRVAGFVWGTGFYINPVPPEQAAGFLQETEVDLRAGAQR